MKVIASVNVGMVNVEVEVFAEDLLATLAHSREGEPRKQMLLRVFNNHAQLMNNLPDEVFAELSEAARKTVGEWYIKQAERLGVRS